MRKILRIVLVMVFSIGFAQEQPTNRFEETEQDYNKEYSEPAVAKEPETAGFPGNPGELPIDDYVPLLVVAAVGIIVYKSYTKNKALS